jgi:FkbM family methyltransferase
MSAPLRPVAYVLAATRHGSMIVNRNDHHETTAGAFGVGQQLLANGCFDPGEIDLALGLLSARQRFFGPGVVALDGGANIGVHTIEWARHMYGWGRVIAFEAQEAVFYALAGNIALNNCWNAQARWAALGEAEGDLDVPEPDYLRPGSFGSLELRARKNAPEFIGQDISYDPLDCVRTHMQSVDGLSLDRLDFLKLDVEGMEAEVLLGSRATIARCRPVVMVEVIKSDEDAIARMLEGFGYRTIREGMGVNMLAVHEEDPTLGVLRQEPA